MSKGPIPRPDKNRMRAQLEEVLRLQKQLLEKIELFAPQTEIDEYQMFWRDLKSSYNELNLKISRYMVRKCNR